MAVLTGGLVNSAGEAIAVFFRGRPDTRSFGTATCGHHHLLDSIPVGGGTLSIVVAQHADRTGRRYAGPVVPDEVIVSEDDLFNRATAWVQSR